MAGRVQKCAAATVAACVSAGSAWAFENPALVPAARMIPGEVRWNGDDARGRWSLVAGASRAAWDPVDPGGTEPLPVAPAEARHALLAESATSRVAFDAQRALFGQRFDASFFATRAALALREDGSVPVASLDVRSLSRLQRTRFGMALALAGRGRSLGLPWERRVAVRVAGERFDARTTLGNSWSGAQSDLRREDAAETRIALEARQSWALAPGLEVAAGGRLERQRTSAGTLDAPQMATDMTQLAPSVEITWSPLRSLALFATARRGPEDPSRPLLTRDPFRSLAPGALDPEWHRDNAEAGLRLRSGAWETRISAWQASAPAEIAFSDRGPVQTSRPTARHGMGFDVRYLPLSTLDLRASLGVDASRSAAGPALPGASRVFGSAGATFRMSRDWDAKLSVSYLGPRDNVDEGASLDSTTLANLQVVRWFGRTTRISLDVFNLFNQRTRAVDSLVASRSGMLDGTGETFLSSPAEPRGFLLKLRTRF